MPQPKSSSAKRQPYCFNELIKLVALVILEMATVSVISKTILDDGINCRSKNHTIKSWVFTRQ